MRVLPSVWIIFIDTGECYVLFWVMVCMSLHYSIQIIQILLWFISINGRNSARSGCSNRWSIEFVSTGENIPDIQRILRIPATCICCRQTTRRWGEMNHDHFTELPIIVRDLQVLCLTGCAIDTRQRLWQRQGLKGFHQGITLRHVQFTGCRLQGCLQQHGTQGYGLVIDHGERRFPLILTRNGLVHGTTGHPIDRVLRSQILRFVYILRCMVDARDNACTFLLRMAS